MWKCDDMRNVKMKSIDFLNILIKNVQSCGVKNKSGNLFLVAPLHIFKLKSCPTPV